MKTPKNKILFLISTVTLCVLASLCGILVCQSHLPYMTKYSFAMLLLIGLCVLLVLMMNAFERISDQLNGNLLAKRNEEICTLKEQLEALQKQVKNQKTPVPVVQEDKPAVGDADLLRKKCETIENFRNSFPYRIADGYILYNIMRTEIQVSGYSRWQLVGEFEGNLWEYTLLRPDTQSYKEMLSLAAATTAPAELEELNISKQLLWN